MVTVLTIMQHIFCHITHGWWINKETHRKKQNYNNCCKNSSLYLNQNTLLKDFLWSCVFQGKWIDSTGSFYQMENVLAMTSSISSKIYHCIYVFSELPCACFMVLPSHIGTLESTQTSAHIKYQCKLY
jgi:hypothetical protein